MAKAFSFNRLWMVIKHEFLENLHDNIKVAIFLYIIIFLCSLNIVTFPSSNLFDAQTEVISCYVVLQIAVYAIGWLTLFIYASKIMNPMKTKQLRISFLMLPAERLEKFIARFLHVTIGCIVIISVATTAAELTRIAVSPIFGVEGELRYVTLLSPGVRNEIIKLLDSSIIEMYVTRPLLYLSVYILGGCLWRSQPFLKSLLLIIILHIAGLMPSNDSRYLPETLASNMIVTDIILSVVLWIISYFIFRRSLITK